MIIYFSKTGNSENLAKVLCKVTGDKIFKVEESRPIKGKFGLFKSSFDAITKKEVEINPLPTLQQEKEIYLSGPIWAGALPPAINKVLTIKELEGKTINFIATCGNAGKTEKYKQYIEKRIAERGLKAGKILVFTQGKNVDLEIIEEHLRKLLEL